MRIFSVILLLTVISAAYGSENFLKPEDFGLRLNEYNQIDMGALPPDIIVSCFNGDVYEDIARFVGNSVEIYFRYGSSFPENPDLIKYFNKNIGTIRTEGDQWNVYRDIVVTFVDGSEERIKNAMGDIQIENSQTSFTKYTLPPKHITEADFQIVWQSEQKPYGMNRMAVDDIDSDGIIELCTYWLPSYPCDSLFILIYKNIGNDNYELSLNEPFTPYFANSAYINFMMITDLDQNGQKEICYT